MNTTKKTLASASWLERLAILYSLTAVMMNIFCMKPLSFGSPYIICDGGLLISWGTFLLSNVIVEVWGEEKAKEIVKFSSITTFTFLVLGRLIVLIPTLPSYSEQALSFSLVFSNGPRTIIASVLAFFIGSFINVEIIAKLKRKRKEKKKDNYFYFFLRSSFSTIVGQIFDNAIFMVFAFAPIGLSLYEMAWKDILTSVLSGTVIEVVIESSLVPFITIPLTKHILKLKEKEDEGYN